jgi:hypothetical protein
MCRRPEASILNVIACIAAFALVALIAMFGHPAASDRATAVTAIAGSSVQANSAPIPAN